MIVGPMPVIKTLGLGMKKYVNNKELSDPAKRLSNSDKGLSFCGKGLVVSDKDLCFNDSGLLI